MSSSQAGTSGGTSWVSNGSGAPREEGEVEESDPSNRWLRYKERLGQGSFKVCYKGFDKKLGIEIAWNKINVYGRQLSEDDKMRLNNEVKILKSLNNPHIIKCYGAWKDKEDEMNFVTELFTSGTLRDYRRKHKGIDAKHAVRRWGKDILLGLQYLHSQEPPIIHRDLKCDNIFINGNSGEVKIADLGLAVLQNKAQTVIGTPEFMAPELYDEHYDERVDIYAFGMVMLELATLRFPYDEMKNPAQIFKAVCAGRLPGALVEVEDPDVMAIIRACINHDPTQRPSAAELLSLPFYAEADSNTDEQKTEIRVLGSLRDTAPGDPKVVHLQLQLPREGQKREMVEFDFDVETDTTEALAEEMAEALNLDSNEQMEVLAKIEYRVSEVMESQRDKMSGIKKSKSHATLVRVPVANEVQGVTVSQNPDNKAKYRINICTHDRNNLLWEVTNSLHELPLRVTNATIKTTDEGVVMDAFDVLVDPQCTMSAMDVQLYLSDRLKL